MTRHPSRRRRALAGLVVGAVIAASLCLQASTPRTLLAGLERQTRDLRFRLLRPEGLPLDPRIEILAIDEHGLALMEHALPFEGLEEPWPWKRWWYALLVEYLRAGGATAVVFDFDFSSPSPHDAGGGIGDDDAFSQAIAEGGRVCLGVLFKEKFPPSAQTAELLRTMVIPGQPLEALRAHALADGAVPADVTLPTAAWSLPPRGPLLAGAAAVGATNSLLDPDGVIRSLPLLWRFEGATYPSLALAASRLALGLTDIRLEKDGRLVLDGPGGRRTIPLTPDGRMHLLWNGPMERYRARGLAAILLNALTWKRGETPEVPPEYFEDRIVLVGSTATGLHDLTPNAYTPLFLGLYAQATAIDNLITGRTLSVLSPAVDLGVAASLAALLGFLIFVVPSPRTNLLAWAAIAGGHVAAAQWAFLSRDTWMSVAAPQMAFGLVLTGGLATNYVLEGRQRRRMRSIFSLYLPARVVDQVADLPPEALSLGGTRRPVTVLFNDIVGFTTISESLTPEALVGLLNEYLTVMTDAILEEEGTVDKYIGDCIMAFWNAPMDQPDHAIRACRAVLRCRDTLVVLRKQFSERGLPEVRARFGVNSGPALIGNMGSVRRFQYTAVGDVVNLASRLEGAAKQYGVEILIGEETVALAGEAIVTREVDRVRVKGKVHPVAVHELLGVPGRIDPLRHEVVHHYEDGLARQRARDWSGAIQAFERALERDATDGPSRLHLGRCRTFLDHPPPPDWDGVHVLTEK